jgi:DNA-binding transcriptional regulator GbsR (MarR family)
MSTSNVRHLVKRQAKQTAKDANLDERLKDIQEKVHRLIEWRKGAQELLRKHG